MIGIFYQSDAHRGVDLYLACLKFSIDNIYGICSKVTVIICMRDLLVVILFALYIVISYESMRVRVLFLLKHLTLDAFTLMIRYLNKL